MKKVFTPTEHTFTTTDFAVVAALLDYHGLPYSVRSLNDYLHHHAFGSLMTEVADCLLQHGLETTLVSANPELFSRALWKKLFLLDYPHTDPNRVPTANEVERVIAKGVMLRQALPSFEMIDEQLEQEQPVIIGYNPKLIEPLRKSTVTLGIITAQENGMYQLFEPFYENLLEMHEKKTVLLAVQAVQSPDPSANSIILSKVHTPRPTTSPGPLPEI